MSEPRAKNGRNRRRRPAQEAPVPYAPLEPKAQPATEADLADLAGPVTPKATAALPTGQAGSAPQDGDRRRGTTIETEPSRAPDVDGSAEPSDLAGISPLTPEGPPPIPPALAPEFAPSDEPPGPTMSYVEHLEELRQRLIKSVIALVIAVALSLLFTNTIFDLLKSRAEGVTLIRTGVAEMIGTYVKVAFISGLILATPVWLYQIVMFIAPGLTRQERRYLFASLPGIIASFVIGVLFGYFVLLPPALNFLLHFGEDIALPLIRIGDYVSVVTSLLFWIGVIFETPLIIYLLARLGIVTPSILTRHRRHAYVGAFVLAAIITPTIDPVNQTLVAVPIMILYELGILLARIAARARRPR